MPVQLAPSVLAADLLHLGRDVAAVATAGADLLHVDVMDGHFVPNLTFGPPMVQALRRASPLRLDVHLMIERPELSLAAYAAAGAHQLTVHVEACPHLHRTLGQIRELGVVPGVALNPGTPVGLLEDILPLVDWVLLMSVNPGFGGQRFLEAAPGRIAELAARRRDGGLRFAIAVDGGIDASNIRRVVAAGADVCIAGSAIFGGADPAAAMRTLRAAGDGQPLP